MLWVLVTLTLTFFIASCESPRSGINFIVPVHTLKRLGFNDGDLNFRLSPDSSCKHEFSNHNYTVMFGNEGNWNGIRVWTQHATLYLTRRDARRIQDEVHYSIRFKEKWDAAWKGNYNLPLAYKSFICNKENKSAMWECFVCDICRDKREDIYNHLSKYK